jgi:hypothetical protein
MRLLRTFAVVVTGACGLTVLLSYFISDPLLSAAGRVLVDWVTILAAAALVLGILNLARVHGGRIASSRQGWPYSAALLGGMLVTLLLGFAPGSTGGDDPALSWVFDYIYQPLSAAVLSLLAFYMATAAYRALRLRTWEALGLMAAGVIVLLGQLPLTAQMWSALPLARTWLLGVVSTAGMRGIIIAASLGAIFTGLRVLMGFDRHYLDRDN